MIDPKFKALMRRRMAGPGNYVICSPDRLQEAVAMARAGDTISLHPREPSEPPTLYEVKRNGQLRQLDPEVD